MYLPTHESSILWGQGNAYWLHHTTKYAYEQNMHTTKYAYEYLNILMDMAGYRIKSTSHQIDMATVRV